MPAARGPAAYIRKYMTAWQALGQAKAQGSKTIGNCSEIDRLSRKEMYRQGMNMPRYCYIQMDTSIIIRHGGRCCQTVSTCKTSTILSTRAFSFGRAFQGSAMRCDAMRGNAIREEVH